MTLADLASRLGWLPCGTCSGGRVLGDCPSCNGVGWLPSPAVLEAMAEATHGQANDWHPPFDVCTCHKQARAAWEAQARLILEGSDREDE
jgi:hypothetical protein